MESETGITAIIAAIVILIIGGFFGALWFFMRRANSDPTLPKPYPFDDPNFIHVGLAPRQLETLKPLALELRFMQWIPRHENQLVDATYYAMSREEFISFFGVVTKYTRKLISDAAAAARLEGKAYLDGDAFTLSELLIGLTGLRQKLDPNPLPDELQIPLAPPVDSAPA